jgi:hypothetical protein
MKNDITFFIHVLIRYYVNILPRVFGQVAPRWEARGLAKNARQVTRNVIAISAH